MSTQELRGKPRLQIFWYLIFLATALAALAGCGFSGSATAVNSPVALRGSIRGGQHAVSSASIQLYAAGASGPGSLAQPLLNQAVQSDATGNFEIPASYHCPSPSSQIYLLARGGNPGLTFGSVNPALGLMAMLGPCSSLSPSASIVVNEVTTVGSIWPVAAYMSSSTALGSDSGDTSFAAAASSVNQFVSIQQGSSPGTPTSQSYFAQNSKLYSLANVLDMCVNTAGGTSGDGSPCGALFSTATPTGGSAPTDTLAAAMFIAQNPDTAVNAIFGLVASSSAFQPTLTAAPTDWTLSLSHPVATPVISPGSGSYDSAQQITISDSTGGSSIYYTTDGTSPTSSSPQYSSSFSIATSSTVQAIAVLGESQSDVATSSLTITPTLPGPTVPATSTNQLVFLQQPTNTGAGLAISPAVTVGIEDANGNVIASATNLVRVNLTGVSSLGGTLEVAAKKGISSFSNLAVGSAGAYTLTASSPGLLSATSASFTVSPLQGSGGTLPTATYYVSNSGSDSNNGTSAATPWQTLTKLNSTKMGPGKSATLQCGSVFRETLTISQSGTAGAPISYGSYGDCTASNLPLISGADHPTAWSPQSEGAYTAYFATEGTAPSVVFEDNHRLAKTSSQSAMPIGSFFYDSSTHRLYVRTKQDAAPGSHLIEASVRANSIVLGGTSFVSLLGLEADKATQANILAWGTLSSVNLSGTVTNYSYGNGIWFTADTGQSQNNVLIQNCTADYNGEDGINKGNFGNDFVVEGCTANYNAFDPQYTFTGGIRFISDGTTDANRATNSGAQNNEAAFNGIDPDTGVAHTSDAGQEGIGVWCDTCGNGSFLTGNIAHDNAKNGVMLEYTGSSGSLSMSGNIAYHNASIGILHSRRSHNDVISNNTSYNNLVNCQFSGENGGGETTVGMVNNIYENNLCASQVLNTSGTVFVAEWGAENNTLGEGSRNIFRNNSFGVPSATNGIFAVFGAGRTVTTYTTLDSRYGKSMNSVEGNPMLSNPAAADFDLMLGSPCIGSAYGGGDVGAIPYSAPQATQTKTKY